MAKQLFSEGLMKMAGIPLEEEPKKILEPRRMEDREEQQKQEEYRELVELINQTGGHVDKLELSNSKLTELPNGLKEVNILELISASISELPVDLKIKRLNIHRSKNPKKIPSYDTLNLLYIYFSSVEEIGEYPNLKWLFCTDCPFLKKAKREARAQRMDVKEYIKQKHKLPQDCSIYIIVEQMDVYP